MNGYDFEGRFYVGFGQEAAGAMLLDKLNGILNESVEDRCIFARNAVIDRVSVGEGQVVD